MFSFSSWLRKTYPGSFGTHKRRTHRKKPPVLAVERLEDRITPSFPVVTKYAGLNAGQSGYVPPDTNGAAGTVSYVQTANQVIEIFPNKTSSSNGITDQLSDFFYNQGGLPSDWQSGGVFQGNPGLSDPIVVWDEQINRFIVGDQQIDFSGGDVSAFYIAVSKSANPASLTKNDWNFYSIDITETSNGGYFADYPGNFGWNHDAFVFVLNMFANGGGGTDHVVVGSVNIQDLVNGVSEANLHYYKNDLNDFDDRPTVMHDSVAGDPMWLVTEHGDGQHIDLIKMTNVLSNSASFNYTTIAVTPYSNAVPPLQKDGSQITGNTDSRIMKAAEYNGLLVASHAVSNAAGDRDFARWYEFNVSSGTPTLVQQGNVTDATSGAGQAGVYDNYPVVDINQFGAIGMTYSQSGDNGTYSATGWMSAFDTVWTPVVDAAGTMEPPTLIQAGGAKNNDGREGDMSGINTDSDGSFWATSEYTNGSSQWVEEASNFLTYATEVNLTGGGNLIISDITQNGKNDGLTISLVTNPSGLPAGKYVQVQDPNFYVGAYGSAIQVDNHAVDALLSSITGSIQITTLAGNDSVTLNYAGGDPIPAGGMSYDGGTGTNAFTVENGTSASATDTFTNSTSGTLNLGSDTITVANLSSIADTDTNTNETFNLPGGAKATLADDGTSNNGISQITSSNNTVIPTTYSDPSGSLTVATNGSSSTVQLAAMDNGFAPTTEAFSGKSGDIFQLTAAGAVPSATSVTLTTATLDLNGLSPTINALNGNGTITDSVSTAVTLTIGTSNGTGTFTGVIQNGSGAVALTKTGTGTETLSGANTYGGTTTISAGKLADGLTNALPTGTTLSDSGTFDLNGFSQQVAVVTGSGTLTNSSGTAGTFTVNNNSADTLAGSITGAALALTKTAAGTLTLTGSSNSYGGATTISAGTLQVGAANAVPSTSDVTDNATLDLDGNSDTIGALAGSGTVTSSVAGAVTLTVGATNNSGSFSGVIQNGSGTIALTKTGSGTETLSGGNSYGGATTISAGTLQVGATTTIPSGSDVTDNATLDLDGHGDTIGALTGSGTVTSSVAGAATLTVGATNNSGSFSGFMQNGSGIIALTKTGSGTETVSGSNTYTGATTISTGTLQVGSNKNPIPSTSDVTNNATLDLGGNSDSIGALAGSGAVTSSVAGAVTLTVGATNNSGSFSGFMQNGSGTIALTKTGTGTETLSGGNSYGGATTISAGTLQVGATNTIPSGSDVTDNATLDLDGHSDTIGALIGSGTVTSSVAGSVTLTVGATNNSGSFSGVIQNGSGTVALTKSGTGTETLSNTNTYGGITTIGGGTLSISSDSNLGTAPGAAVANQITLSGGATLQLTNGSAVTINANRGLTLLSSGGTILTSGAAVSYAGAIAGATGLSKSGAGDLFLQDNASLSAPGAVSDSAGRLFFSSQDALGTSAVSVAGGAVLDYTGVSALTLSNTVIFSSGADAATRSAALTLPASTVLPASGTMLFNNDDQPTSAVIVQSGVVLTGTLTVQVGGGNATVGTATLGGALTGSGGLTKTQGGTLILSSSGDSYGGATSVSAGTLEVDGTVTSNVTVSGTGTLDGTGTVGTVTATAGTVAPGPSAGTGTLATGSVNLKAGSSFNVGIGGGSAGQYGADGVDSGTVTLDTTGAGVTLNLSALSYTPTANDTYVLFNNAGGSAITGTFVAGTGIDGVASGSPLPEGAILSTNFLGSGLSATITYAAGSGHDSVAIIVGGVLTVSIGSPSKTVTNKGPVSFPVTYNDKDGLSITSTLNTTDVHLVATGTATGTLSFDGSSGANRTVTISNISGDGTLAITIDANSAVDTGANFAAAVGPSTTFLVDNTAPTSSVNALPSFSPGTFTLSWSGQDNTGGSGLASYSIYVSDNGGSFTPLISNTTTTSISFTGTDGHTYGYYSIATDNAGNVQSTPGSAQATTKVDATPPTSTVTALPGLSPGTFTVSWSGHDNTGGSGLASYTIYISDNGGAFGPLISNTTTTSISFAGTDGHTYGFYSIATDNVGNVQPTPGSALATN